MQDLPGQRSVYRVPAVRSPGVLCRVLSGTEALSYVSTEGQGQGQGLSGLNTEVVVALLSLVRILGECLIIE